MKIINFNSKVKKPPSSSQSHPTPSPHPPQESTLFDPEADCNICMLEVLYSDKGIQCDKCNLWVHAKCNKTSHSQYEDMTNNYDEIFECRKCLTCSCCKNVIAKNHKKLLCSACNMYSHKNCNDLSDKDFDTKKNSDFLCQNCIKSSVPFTNLNDFEFSMLVTDGVLSDTLSTCNSLSNFQLELCKKFSNCINKKYQEVNEDEEFSSINCEYHSVESYLARKINKKMYMSILHLNIHSITRHIEDFKLFLLRLKTPFDFICISESKLEKGQEPIVDISIPGFQLPPEYTHTESTKGGVLIYVREGISYKVRNDLLMYKAKELESKFFEVINKKGPNDIIGTIYRHPSMNEKEFNDNYITSFLGKISKGSKRLFISGDFNYDMLSIDNHEETANFFDGMMNNFLLPSINKPPKSYLQILFAKVSICKWKLLQIELLQMETFANGNFCK